MPIEVYPIRGNYEGRNIRTKDVVSRYIKDNESSRTPEVVADEIKERYQRIIDAGGKIVANIVVPRHIGDSTQYGPRQNSRESFIYVVADMPEAEDK